MYGEEGIPSGRDRLMKDGRETVPFLPSAPSGLETSRPAPLSLVFLLVVLAHFVKFHHPTYLRRLLCDHDITVIP
jgi:hypothetical protein